MANPNKFTAKEVLNKVLLDSSGNAVSANSVTSQEALSMALDATNNRLNVALEGGTISGDVTITGDLTVQGSATNTYDEQIQGLHHVYVDDTTLFQSIIEQDGTGDAALKFDLTGARSWLIGLDNSDGDAFKICADANDLKDSTAITIDTNLNVGFGATPTTFHSSLTGVQIGGNGILQHETSAGAGKTFKIAQNVREEFTSGDFTYISTD